MAPIIERIPNSPAAAGTEHFLHESARDDAEMRFMPAVPASVVERKEGEASEPHASPHLKSGSGGDEAEV